MNDLYMPLKSEKALRRTIIGVGFLGALIVVECIVGVVVLVTS